VEEALEALDLTHLAERPVTQLSAGERHRVFLARALATQAPVQLWDEPTASLDVRHTLEILRMARQLGIRGRTLVISLHDLRLALAFDRVLVLDKGTVRGFGTPDEVLDPATLADVFGVRAHMGQGMVLELANPKG
jgi:iron complex transport system ATP-binding protein